MERGANMNNTNSKSSAEPSGHHNLILEDRKVMSLTGVTDIDNFDDKSIKLYTELGELVVQGRDLRVNELNVETGSLCVEGDIWSLVYGDKSTRKTPTILSKLFK